MCSTLKDLHAVWSARMARSPNSGAQPTGKPLEDALAHFVQDKEKTVGSGNYAAAADRVVGKWLETHCEDIGNVADIESTHVAGFATRLRQRAQAREADPDNEEGISGRTAHQYYSYVRAFITHCQQWGWIDHNPAKLERVQQQLPPESLGATDTQQFWSPEERRQLCQYADECAHDAMDENGLTAYRAMRDRALVYLLSYTGARVGELVRDSRDDRRTGIVWADVDFENNHLIVLGKDQEREAVQFPEQAQPAVERWLQVYDPADDTWPVIPTLHAPTLGSVLPDDLSMDTDDTLATLRDAAVRPPSLSVSGVRTVLKRLCRDGEITVQGDREYLTPHGARRGVGETLYRTAGHQAAQRALRHADPSTTSKMYSHIEASELSEVASEAFDELDETAETGG